MTTEEICKLLEVPDRHRSIVVNALTTSEKRGRLMESLMQPCRLRLDFTWQKWRNGKRTPGEARSLGERLLRQLEGLDGEFDGSEPFDRVRYGCLVSDLRVFLSELAP